MVIYFYLKQQKPNKAKTLDNLCNLVFYTVPSLYQRTVPALLNLRVVSTCLSRLSPTFKPLGYRSCQGKATNHNVIVARAGFEPACAPLNVG